MLSGFALPVLESCFAVCCLAADVHLKTIGACSQSQAFPQQLFRLTPCNPEWVFRVSYRYQCYSVLPCSDRDTILVLHSLTPEKVGLPRSELPPSRSVMTSRCKHFPLLLYVLYFGTNANFSLNGNLQLFEYETKKYNIIIIIIYHDFLPTPRRGSHVKSGKTHTQSSRYTP